MAVAQKADVHLAELRLPSRLIVIHRRQPNPWSPVAVGFVDQRLLAKIHRVDLGVEIGEDREQEVPAGQATGLGRDQGVDLAQHPIGAFRILDAVEAFPQRGVVLAGAQGGEKPPAEADAGAFGVGQVGDHPRILVGSSAV